MRRDRDGTGPPDSRPTPRRSPSLVVIAALIVLGAVAFVAVGSVPARLDVSGDTKAAVALALRLFGFASLLAAGALLMRRSKRP